MTPAHAAALAVIAAGLVAAVVIRIARDRRSDAAVARYEAAPFSAPGCLRVPRDEVCGEIPLPRRIPGSPVDGKPLSFAEQRALAAVDMDSMITVPEPLYRAGTERGTT